jgi:23S rRNA (pseudouridine1915-N3)-methyltransferase
MKITLLLNGRTEEKHFADALSFYEKRIKHYLGFNIIEIPSPRGAKSMTEDIYKLKEAELTERHISPADHVVLLDERGREYRSVEFSGYLQRKMNGSTRHLVFVCGGPFGFAERILKRADERMSLSRMTFPHQLARVIFAEQLYRALSILRGEPYHHE